MWLLPERETEANPSDRENLDCEAIGRLVRLRTLKAVTAHFALLAILADGQEPTRGRTGADDE